MYENNLKRIIPDDYYLLISSGWAFRSGDYRNGSRRRNNASV